MKERKRWSKKLLRERIQELEGKTTQWQIIAKQQLERKLRELEARKEE